MVYNISYKSLIGTKPLRIRFDKVDGFIIIYDGIRYLALLGTEKYNVIYNRIRYLVSQESGISYVIPHNYARMKINYYEPLPLKKHWLCVMM